jgi:hypothetical protein
MLAPILCTQLLPVQVGRAWRGGGRLGEGARGCTCLARALRKRETSPAFYPPFNPRKSQPQSAQPSVTNRSQLTTPVTERKQIERTDTAGPAQILILLKPSYEKLSHIGWPWAEGCGMTPHATGFPIGGLNEVAPSGWFAARPSGTAGIYRMSGKSFPGADHVGRILLEAQAIVSGTSPAAPKPKEKP